MPPPSPLLRKSGWRWALWLVAVLLLVPGLAGGAQAGAWPRGKGQHFASGAYRLNLDLQGNTSSSYTYFHEYGLTDTWTIGLDVGGAISGFDKAVVFASRAYAPVFGIHYASEFGMGTIAEQAVVRPGLAIGIPLDTPPGWLSLEAATEYYPLSGATDWKVDVTWGYVPSDRAKYYLQVQTGQHAGDAPFARLAGSVAWRIHGGLYADLGASVRLHNSDPFRLKLGFWWET